MYPVRVTSTRTWLGPRPPTLRPTPREGWYGNNNSKLSGRDGDQESCCAAGPIAPRRASSDRRTEPRSWLDAIRNAGDTSPRRFQNMPCISFVHLHTMHALPGLLLLLSLFELGSAGSTCGANTWRPSWASSPDAACALWAGSTSWGALKNGQTLEEGCRTSTFAQQGCSLTCCDYQLPPSIVKTSGGFGAGRVI